MGSGINTTIRLEPFLQEFLRGYYHCNSYIFKFPKSDDDLLGIARKFNCILRPKPDKFKFQNYGNETFIIEVPYLEFENKPFLRNYISETGMKILASKIREEQKNYFHEYVSKLRNEGFEYLECTKLYMDEFKISEAYMSRLVKDYKRWRDKLRVNKFRDRYHPAFKKNLDAVYV